MSYDVGQTYERWTPFIVEDKTICDGFDENGCSIPREIKSWRPGLRWVQSSPDDSDPEWDGEGAEVRTIVAVTKIDGGGVRILYRRSWRKPDGTSFGKRTVKITTPSGFTAWHKGSQGYLRNEFSDKMRREAA